MFTNYSFCIDNCAYTTDFLHLVVSPQQVVPPDRSEHYIQYCEVMRQSFLQMFSIVGCFNIVFTRFERNSHHFTISFLSWFTYTTLFDTHKEDDDSGYLLFAYGYFLHIPNKNMDSCMGLCIYAQGNQCK